MKNQILKLTLVFALLGVAAKTPAQSFLPIINNNSGYYPEGITVDNVYNNPITAQFTTVLGGGFWVENEPASIYENINGDTIWNNTPSDSLVATFSAPITSFQINFQVPGFQGTSVMDVTAYLNGSVVGTQTYGTSVTLDPTEGQVFYQNNGGFNKLVIGEDPAVPSADGDWVMGTDVASTGNFGNQIPVPEPSTLALAGLGGLGLLTFRRRSTK